jgi:hypothetical protein
MKLFSERINMMDKRKVKTAIAGTIGIFAIIALIYAAFGNPNKRRKFHF